MKLSWKLFFLPGNVVANILGATEVDGRTMLRALIDMLFWNPVIVVGASADFL